MWVARAGRASGGTPFRFELVRKGREGGRTRSARGLFFRIEVDGGINATTAGTSIAAGADTLVAGASVFGALDMATAIRTIRTPS